MALYVSVGGVHRPIHTRNKLNSAALIGHRTTDQPFAPTTLSRTPFQLHGRTHPRPSLRFAANGSMHSSRATADAVTMRHPRPRAENGMTVWSGPPLRKGQLHRTARPRLCQVVHVCSLRRVAVAAPRPPSISSQPARRAVRASLVTNRGPSLTLVTIPSRNSHRRAVTSRTLNPATHNLPTAGAAAAATVGRSANAAAAAARHRRRGRIDPRGGSGDDPPRARAAGARRCSPPLPSRRRPVELHRGGPQRRPRRGGRVGRGRSRARTRRRGLGRVCRRGRVGGWRRRRRPAGRPLRPPPLPPPVGGGRVTARPPHARLRPRVGVAAATWRGG